MFHPDLRVVFDTRLNLPVVQVGWWLNAAGERVGAEICTMVQTRRVDELRLILPATQPESVVT